MIVATSAPVATARRRVISSSATSAPSPTRVSIAPSSRTRTAWSAVRVDRVSATTAACSAVSTTSSRTSASARIHCTCSAEDVSYSGTGTAPAAQTAKSSSVHSKRVRLMMPTLCPGSMPRATSPLATATTAASTSRAVTGSHRASVVALRSMNVTSAYRSSRPASSALMLAVGSAATTAGKRCSSMLAPSAHGSGPDCIQSCRGPIVPTPAPKTSVACQGSSPDPAATCLRTQPRTDMYAIGVDIGGTKIAAGVVDEDGRIIAKTRRDSAGLDVDALDAAVVDACRELAAGYSVGAIGLAAPGFIGADQATVRFTPNLPWRDHPLRDRVAAGLGLAVPIVVDNDANAAGWAEFRFGVGRDVDDMLLLTLGTGLGGAVVAAGRLVLGAWGVAAEVGHMRVVPDGHTCGCGQQGCWEQYVSGSALVRDARSIAGADPQRAARLLELAGGDPAAITGPSITAAALDGDPLSVELLAEVGRWVGEGSATVAALLDPALVVIGGGVAAADHHQGRVQQ